MREFFRGWKRKAGVATLAVALVFAVGLVRSQFTRDHMFLNFRSVEGTIDSHHGNLALGYAWNSPYTRFDFNWYADKLKQELIDGLGFGYEEDSMLVRAGDLDPQLVQIRDLRMPYWSIIVPLTALAAYLLLVPPRTKKPQPHSQPTA